MFLNSFRQNANAKIVTTICYQATIVIQITKNLDIIQKKTVIVSKSAPQSQPRTVEKP